MTAADETPQETTRIEGACAVLHTDGQGNNVPCPGYPHTEQQIQPDAYGLYDCPHCTDTVIDLDEHLATCTAFREQQLAEARHLLAEEQQQQDEACRAEIEAVLAKYGRKLIVTQPQISIAPM